MNLSTWLRTAPTDTRTFAVLMGVGLFAFILMGAIVSATVDMVSGTSLDPLGLQRMSTVELILWIGFAIVLTPFGAVLEGLIFLGWLSVLGKFFSHSSMTVVAVAVSSIAYAALAGGPLSGMINFGFGICYLKLGGQNGEFWQPVSVIVGVRIIAYWAVLAISGTLILLGTLLGG